MKPIQHISEAAYTNHLINATSPYLLQHAHNPVDWYPWGDEALARAREEDKPIFLSIGYAACHWCHVMERESFENEKIATFLNLHFIAIKVDREERPDLDDIYMTAVQMLTGNGGWPMSIFLTPRLEPFFAGTYFPPHDYYGTPGFLAVLHNVAKAWDESRNDILEKAASLTSAIRRYMSSCDVTSAPVTDDLCASAIKALRETYDKQNGGFGNAPKFPPSGAVALLLRKSHESGEEDLLEMATTTLAKMACGGMYDQLGGGFHRYSTDAQWMVPHFEKMLYDNALLAHVYMEAFQRTGISFYRDIATETLDYVLRDMADEAGGFHSSEDADSEGREGMFYLWTRDEVCSVLGSRDADKASEYYGINTEGNFESRESCHRGQNILHRDAFAVSHPEWDVNSWKMKLLDARDTRERPACDDKVLTSWNAMMISAFTLGAQVTGHGRYGEAAENAGHFLLSSIYHDGLLYRVYRKGERRLPGYLDDYACTAVALLDLFETTFELRWLRGAEAIVDKMVAEFWDKQSGSFYATGANHANLIARSKPAYDGAEPSGNTMAATALLRLGRLLDQAEYIRKAEHILEGNSGMMRQYPMAYLRMLTALEHFIQDPVEIVLVGPLDSGEINGYLRVVHNHFIPNKTIVAFDPNDSSATHYSSSIPLVSGKTLVDGKPAVYLCKGHVCHAPVTTPEQLAMLLQQ